MPTVDEITRHEVNSELLNAIAQRLAVTQVASPDTR
jgi:hypothetical protein